MVEVELKTVSREGKLDDASLQRIRSEILRQQLFDTIDTVLEEDEESPWQKAKRFFLERFQKPLEIKTEVPEKGVTPPSITPPPPPPTPSPAVAEQTTPPAPSVSVPPAPAETLPREKKQAKSIIDMLSAERLGGSIMEWATAQPPPIKVPEPGETPDILKATARGIEETIPPFVFGLAGKKRENLEFIHYEPKTTTEKIARQIGSLGTFLGGAGVISKTLSLLPFVTEGTMPFLKKGMIGDAIRLMETRFPKLVKYLTGNIGLEGAIDHAIKTGTSFAIFNQSFLERGTPLRERVKQAAKDYIAGAFLTRLAGINSTPLRATAHGAFGFASSILQGDGDMEDALISSGIWTAIGAAGGLRFSPESAERELVRQAEKVLKSDPELAPQVEEVRKAVRKTKGVARQTVRERQRGKAVGEIQKLNAELEKAVTETSEKVDALNDAINASRKKIMSRLDPAIGWRNLTRERTIQMKEFLDKDFLEKFREIQKETERSKDEEIRAEIAELFNDIRLSPADIGEEVGIRLSERISPEEFKEGIRVTSVVPETPDLAASLIKNRLVLEIARKTGNADLFLETVRNIDEKSRLRPSWRYETIKEGAAKELVQGYFKDERELDAFVTEIYNLLKENTHESLDLARKKELKWSGDQSLYYNVIENFKNTEGRYYDLVDSILRASGKEFPETTSKGAKAKVASSIVNKWGYSNVKEMYADIESSYKDIFNQLRKSQMAQDIVNHDVTSQIRSSIVNPRFTPKETELFREKIKNGEVLEPEEVGTAKDKLRSLRDIEREMMLRLNAAILDARLPKNVGGRVLGEDVILLKDKSWMTFAEEWAHLLDRKFNMTANIAELSQTDPTFKIIERELIRKAPKEVKDNYKKEQWLVESFAKMIREYLRGEPIWERYPHAFEFFKESVRSEVPSLWDSIVQARAAITTRETAPAVAVAETDIYEKNTGQWLRLSLTEAKEGILHEKIKNLFQDAYEKNFDVFRAFYRLDKHAGIPERESVGWRAETLEGRINGAAEFFYTRGIPVDFRDITQRFRVDDIPTSTRGLYEIINDIPVELLPKVGVYRVAKRFEALHKAARKEGREFKFPEEWSPEKTRKVIKEIEENFPEVRGIAEEFRQFHDALRKLYFDMGELTPEAYEKMNKIPYYTALMREGNFFGNDFEFNTRMNETLLKRYFGSTREDIVDPFLQDHTLVYGAAKRMITKDLLLRIRDIAEKFPSKLAYIERQFPLKMTELQEAEIIRIARERLGLNEKQIEKLRETLRKEDPEVVSAIWRPFTTFEKDLFRIQVKPGKFEYLRLDPRLADAMNLLHRNTSVWAGLNAMRYITNVVRQTATTYNPYFLVKNPMRDALSGYIQADALFVPILDSVKGLSSYLKKDKYYRAAQLYGLKYESLQSEGLQPREIRPNVEPLTGLAKAGKNIIDSFRFLANGSEMMTRIGVLRKYNIDDPLELMRGIRDAQKATYFWGKRGMKDSPLYQLNKVTAFLKANVIVAESQIRHLGKLRTYKRALPLVVLSLLHAYAMRDNEDYWDLPMWRHVMGLNIPNPLKPGSFILFPFIGDVYFMAFFAFPQVIAKMVMDKKESRRLKAFLEEAFDQWSPGAFSRTGIIPNVLTPLLQAFYNRNFGNIPLVPERFKNLRKEAWVLEKTSNIAILLSRAINKVYGKFTGGKELVSPIHIDHYLSAYLVGLYQIIANTTDVAATKLGISVNDMKEEIEGADIPVINAFLRQELSPSSGYEARYALDRIKEFQAYSNTWKEYTTQSAKKGEEYLKENGPLINIGLASANFEAALRRQIALWNNIGKRRDIPLNERKEIKREINKNIYQMARMTNMILDMYQEDLKRSKVK